MRNFINIIEAKIKTRPSVLVDREALKRELASIIKTLRADPFHIALDRKTADSLIAALQKRKAEHEKDAADYPEDDYGPFNVEDNLEVALQSTARTFDLCFSLTSRDVAQEEDDYQHRAIERHGFAADFSDGQYVESSTFLSAMEAQRKCAIALAHVHNVDKLYSPDVFLKVLTELKTFIQTYNENHMPRDGGEEAVIVDNFREGLAELLPLLSVISLTW